TRVVVGFDQPGGAAAEAFDAALVTVPLGVLKRGAIQFEPDLPPRKRGAIQRIGMGTLDKVFLLYDEAFWDRDIAWIATPENDLPQGQFNQWLILDDLVGKPVIMAFNGGPPALDLAPLPDEEVLGRAVKTLQLAFPNA
ncbi:MAG: FAD-dependent oxidoreductase, partial [Pseudomonadota bacterium]